MKMRKLMAILMVVAMVLSLAACSGKDDIDSDEKDSDGVKTLKFWSFHTGKEGEYLEKFVDEYNSTHDDVQIEHTVVNQSDYTTTLIPTAYANGEAPDILYVEPATFKKYVDKGMLLDLSPYYSDELKADILPSALDAVTVDGKIYALPIEMETLGLFYNVDMLEEAGIDPPKTWDELYEAAKALTTDDVYGLILPVEETSYTLFNWWPFMWMAGADVYDDEGNVTVDSPEMIEALEYWGRFYQEGLVPSSLQIGPWEIGNVGTGVAAMQVSGTYVIDSAENDYPDVNIGVVPLPSPNNNSITVAGGQKMAINANSAYPDEAADFIFSLYGSDDITKATEWTTEAKFAYPARQSVIDANEQVFDSGLRAVFTDFYDTAVPEPSYSAEVTDAMGKMLQEVMFDGVSATDAVKEAQATIENVSD